MSALATAMMPSSVQPVWEVRSETLYFQFGPFVLFKVPFRALTLVSNPFVVPSGLAIPLGHAVATGCEAVVNAAVPVTPEFATIYLEAGALRYAARYGDRYVVDLGGSFAEYLKKFSTKSRHNLQRLARRCIESNSGQAPILEYRTPSEMMLFRDIAIAISHRSHKSEIGWGFTEGDRFARQLEIDAAYGRVRGYVLMLDGKPAAYGFFRVDHDVIVYKHTGYDKGFAQRSPGTVLLYLMLERLFNEGRFRFLDFDGTEYYSYKKFFSTRAILCARVVWFRPTLRNIVLVAVHWLITAAWRLAGTLRDPWRGKRHEWLSARRVARRSARETTGRGSS